MNADTRGLKHKELTETIIGVFYEVYNELGHGFLESVPELIDTAIIPFDFNRSDVEQTIAACEFALEGLYAENKISRNEEGGYTAVTKAKKDRRGMIYDDLSETSSYS